MREFRMNGRKPGTEETDEAGPGGDDETRDGGQDATEQAGDGETRRWIQRLALKFGRIPEEDAINGCKSGVPKGMREPRRIVEGATYHVIARANRREFILSSNVVKAIFIRILIRARTKFDFTVVNICIMENHVHLMLRPGDEESLSRIMQWILSCFAMRFNRHYGIHGHVWYDRFKSFVIANLRQFQRTFSYISDNPVRAGLAATAGDYKYNGLAFIRDGPGRVVDPPTEVVRLLFPGFAFPQLLEPLSAQQ